MAIEGGKDWTSVLMFRVSFLCQTVGDIWPISKLLVIKCSLCYMPLSLCVCFIYKHIHTQRWNKCTEEKTLKMGNEQEIKKVFPFFYKRWKKLLCKLSFEGRRYLAFTNKPVASYLMNLLTVSCYLETNLKENYSSHWHRKKQHRTISNM